MIYTTITSQKQYEQYKQARESLRYTAFCPKRDQEIRLLNKLILEWNDKGKKKREPEKPTLTTEETHKLYMKEYMKQYYKNKKAKKDKNE